MASDLKLRVILNAVDQATGELRKITRGSGELAKTFRASKDQLKELNKQQSDVRAYRIANAETTRQARAIRDLEVKSRGYSQSLDQQRTAHTNLRGNLKTAQSEYNKLAKALINGKGGSAEFQRELQKAQIRLTSARQAFERSSSSIRTYQNQIRSTDKRLTELNRSHGAGQQRLAALRQRLEQAGIGTQGLGRKAREMRKEQERVNTVLDQQRAALARVNEIQRRHQQLNERHAKTMRRTAMVGAAGYAGVAVGRNVLSRASNVMAPGLAYGAQISELQAITRLGKDDERFAMLKAQARQLGATTAFSATEVAAGQTFLARAGFTPEAINASMGDVLAMALANKTDLARTADIASNIAGVFKIDPSIEGNFTRLTDVLSGTAARANVNLEMLGETMKYLGGADDLNLTIEQAAAMAGLMGNIGIQGSQAGTAMRAMMNRLTGPAAAGRKVMEELGLQVADANGDLRELPEILRDINTATKDLGNVQRKAMLTRIFGAEAGSGMAELVGQMADGGLDELLEQLGDLQGENARMASVMADNVQGDLKNLSSAWENIGITLAQTNEGPIRDLINNVTGTVRKIGEWAEENPQLVATIAKVVGVVGLLAAIGGTLAITLASIAAPISLVMFGLGKMFLIGKTLLPVIKATTVVLGALSKGLIVGLAGAAKTAVVALAALGKTLLIGLGVAAKAGVVALAAVAKAAIVAAIPMLPLIAAVGLLTAAAYLLYRNWDGVIGGLKALWAGLVTAARIIWGALATFFTGIWQEISSAFDGGMLGIAKLLINWSPLGLLWRGITSALSALGIEVPEHFKTLGSAMVDGLLNGLKASMGKLKDGIMNVGGAVTGWFKDTLGIRSPSRVFAALGDDTMAGLRVGLERSQRGPLSAVLDAGKAMVQAGALALGIGGAGQAVAVDSRPALAATQAPIIVQGDTITIQLSTAPGTDLAQLEQMINRVLDQREQHKAARIRSALYDTN